MPIRATETKHLSNWRSPAVWRIVILVEEFQKVFIHCPDLLSSLERPINPTVRFLDKGRKLEYPEKTNVCTWRTCKLPAESPQSRIQTQDLLPQSESGTN